MGSRHFCGRPIHACVGGASLHLPIHVGDGPSAAGRSSPVSSRRRFRRRQPWTGPETESERCGSGRGRGSVHVFFGFGNRRFFLQETEPTLLLFSSSNFVVSNTYLYIANPLWAAWATTTKAFSMSPSPGKQPSRPNHHEGPLCAIDFNPLDAFKLEASNAKKLN